MGQGARVPSHVRAEGHRRDLVKGARVAPGVEQLKGVARRKGAGLVIEREGAAKGNGGQADDLVAGPGALIDIETQKAAGLEREGIADGERIDGSAGVAGRKCAAGTDHDRSENLPVTAKSSAGHGERVGAGSAADEQGAVAHSDGAGMSVEGWQSDCAVAA